MRLKEYLTCLNINMNKFAKQADITEATVRNILAGKRDIHLTTALKIEKATIGAVKCKDLAPEDFKL